VARGEYSIGEYSIASVILYTAGRRRRERSGEPFNVAERNLCWRNLTWNNAAELCGCEFHGAPDGENIKTLARLACGGGVRLGDYLIQQSRPR